MSLNYRLHDRVRFKTWVKLVPSQGADLLSHVEDISLDGLGLEHDHGLEVGRECHIYFMLPLHGRENIVQARCRIATCLPGEQRGRFHIGLAFEEFISDPHGTPALIQAFIEHLNPA